MNGMQMNIEEATAVVRSTQNKYLRGELSEELLAEIRLVFPNAQRDWDKMKLNLLVKKRKLLKKARDLVRQSSQSSRRKKRWKGNFGLSRLQKQMDQINRKFFREGLNVLQTWEEFTKEFMPENM